MDCEDPFRGLSSADAELEDPGCEKAGRGLGCCLLQREIGGHLGGDHVQVSLGIEVVLARRYIFHVTQPAPGRPLMHAANGRVAPRGK